jgi:hypothetical protein
MKYFYNICFADDENDYPALVSGHEDVAHALDKVIGPDKLADRPDD